MPDRSGHIPGAAGHKADSVTQILCTHGEHLDIFHLDAGATLVLKLQSPSRLEIDLGEQVARRTALERVVDHTFVAVVEGPIDVLEQARDDHLRVAV